MKVPTSGKGTELCMSLQQVAKLLSCILEKYETVENQLLLWTV